MDHSIKEILWRQFGASIDMLINVIANSPEEYLISHKRFYYIAYHSTVFLDYYLSVPPRDFNPQLPFTFTDEEKRPVEAVDDLIPNRFYSKTELIGYLQLSRDKCKQFITNLTAAVDAQRFTEDHESDAMDYPLLEILLYNMRHTQHHVAQLHLLIRQDLDQHREWVFQAEDTLQ